MSLKLEGFELSKVHVGHAGRRASHADCVVVADFDRDLAAGHVHGDVAIAEADAVATAAEALLLEPEARV